MDDASRTANTYTTNDFLDMLKDKFQLTSDYQLAGALGWSRSLISTYRTKPQYLGDKNCIEVANILKVPPSFVLCCIHAERAKEPDVKKYWTKMALDFDRRGNLGLSDNCLECESKKLIEKEV